MDQQSGHRTRIRQRLVAAGDLQSRSPTTVTELARRAPHVPARQFHRAQRRNVRTRPRITGPRQLDTEKPNVERRVVRHDRPTHNGLDQQRRDVGERRSPQHLTCRHPVNARRPDIATRIDQGRPLPLDISLIAQKDDADLEHAVVSSREQTCRLKVDARVTSHRILLFADGR
jgi:hypothetical protein